MNFFPIIKCDIDSDYVLSALGPTGSHWRSSRILVVVLLIVSSKERTGFYE